jgi:hypothetical protein
MINKFTRNVAIAALLILITGADLTLALPAQQSANHASLNPAIVSALRGYYAKRGATRLETFKIKRAAVSGPYALVSWNWGDGGGQAALVKKGNQWSVLTSGGGQINAATLIEVGVPKTYADALAAKNR